MEHANSKALLQTLISNINYIFPSLPSAETSMKSITLTNKSTNKTKEVTFNLASLNEILTIFASLDSSLELSAQTLAKLLSQQYSIDLFDKVKKELKNPNGYFKQEASYFTDVTQDNIIAKVNGANPATKTYFITNYSNVFSENAELVKKIAEEQTLMAKQLNDTKGELQRAKEETETAKKAKIEYEKKVKEEQKKLTNEQLKLQKQIAEQKSTLQKFAEQKNEFKQKL
jgi:hypothetical protein